jgi:hypothetical protein
MIPPPPRFVPKQAKLIQGFAAPQFDPRFHTDGALREHTFLGLLVEAWARGKRYPLETVGLINEMQLLEVMLRRDHPALMKEIRENL